MIVLPVVLQAIINQGVNMMDTIMLTKKEARETYRPIRAFPTERIMLEMTSHRQEALLPAHPAAPATREAPPPGIYPLGAPRDHQ